MARDHLILRRRCCVFGLGRRKKRISLPSVCRWTAGGQGGNLAVEPSPCLGPLSCTPEMEGPIYFGRESKSTLCCCSVVPRRLSLIGCCEKRRLSAICNSNEAHFRTSAAAHSERMGSSRKQSGYTFQNLARSATSESETRKCCRCLSSLLT